MGARPAAAAAAAAVTTGADEQQIKLTLGSATVHTRRRLRQRCMISFNIEPRAI